MDYPTIAGKILFGGDVLDNAIRGHFIEALALDALRRLDVVKNVPERWHHVGAGWGPWDLQRGRAADDDRVRFQVKTKSAVQLWKRDKQRFDYDLGLKSAEALPKYFSTDFPVELIGECEPSGYRTDFFLFAWIENGAQSDPNNYDFYILPVRDITPLSKKLTLEALRSGTAVKFSDLPDAMNDAADTFLAAA